MGKAGILPDVTGSFSYWRHQKDTALKTQDWDTMSLALNHMNGALEIEYRIQTDTEEWNNQRDDYIVWKCNNCTTKEKKVINKGEEDQYIKEIVVPTCSDRKLIKIFTVKCNDVIALLSNSKTKKMWICPKCKNESAVKSVETQLRKHMKPHYRGVIYEEPIRPFTGLQRRRGTYPREMRLWGTRYSIELERKLAIYRIEYIRVNGEDMSDGGYQDKGDTN